MVIHTYIVIEIDKSKIDKNDKTKKKVAIEVFLTDF